MSRASWCVASLLLAVLLQGCSKDETPPANNAEQTGNATTDGKGNHDQHSQANPNDNGQNPPENGVSEGPTLTGTPEEQARAAFEDLIAKLEKQDIRAFIELYLPYDAYLELKSQPGKIDEIVGSLQSHPEEFERMVAGFKKFREAKLELTANPAGTEVTFEARLSEGGVDDAFKPTPPDPVKLLETEVGFGGDLKPALEAALKTLQDQEFKKFVEQMLPIAELEALMANDEKDALISELKLPANLDDFQKSSEPGELMVGQMIQDLQAMLQVEPTMEDEGNTAVYKLPGLKYLQGSEKDGTEVQLPERTVKLQKVSGNWRFADQAEARDQLSELQELEPQEAVSSEKFKMVKVLGKWRMKDFR